MRDSVFLACRGVSRRRFSLLRPARATSRAWRRPRLDPPRRPSRGRCATAWSARCRHGQQRQLEIALALAGAPRFILFDEPAAGLSPTERRDLVAILNALPAHIGYIIIEHDLDVALRVSDRVSMMHNGRVFKEGTPAEIESRPGGAGDLSRGRAWLSAPREPPGRLRIEDLQVYYGESHALQGVSLTLEPGVLSVVGRNGMGKTTLCNAIIGPEARAVRLDPLDRPRDSRCEPHEIHRLGVAYVPQGRRVWPSLTVDEHLRLAARRGATRAGRVERVYADLPAPGRAARQRRLAAFGRRAADAGDLPGAAVATRSSSSWTSRPRGSPR